MPDLNDDITRAYGTIGEAPELLLGLDRVLEAHGVKDARVAFERAQARDFLGMEADAIPLYREALARGLGGPERLQCLVQLGSSLRNVGEADAAVQVLLEAREEAIDKDSRDWIDAFLALALHTGGQSAQALGVALAALAPRLTRYQRAVAAYANELL